MIVVGITGSIASGKSTVAAAFRTAGVPVFSADDAVHEIYRDEPRHVAALFPEAVVDGVVDRRRLADRLRSDPAAIAALETAIHPLVRRRTERFLALQREAGAELAAIEVPLLFETGADALCDHVLVTTAPDEVRAARVAARGTMPEALFRQLDARHLSGEEKARRADFVVDSGGEIGDARQRARAIIAQLQAVAAGSGEG